MAAGTLGSDEETTIPWRRSIYVVAPAVCYYRLSAESPPLVHKLGVDCAGMGAVTKLQDGGVAVYGSLEASSKTTRASCRGARRASCTRWSDDRVMEAGKARSVHVRGRTFGAWTSSDCIVITG